MTTNPALDALADIHRLMDEGVPQADAFEALRIVELGRQRAERYQAINEKILYDAERFFAIMEQVSLATLALMEHHGVDRMADVPPAAAKALAALDEREREIADEMDGSGLDAEEFGLRRDADGALLWPMRRRRKSS